MQQQKCYYVLVVEDSQKDRVAAAATLVVELKFIHSCGARGRIEDVVVAAAYRGQQLRKLSVKCIFETAYSISS